MTSTIVLSKTVTSGSNNYGLSGSPITISVWATRVQNKITSGLAGEFQRPALTSQTTTAPENNIIDTRQTIESWQIDGFIDDDLGGDTAITKAQKLMAIKQAGGTLDSFIYRDLTITFQAYIFQMNNVDINYDPDDISRAGEAKIQVQMEIRRGKVIGT